MFLEANGMSKTFLEKVDPWYGRSKREMLGPLEDHSEELCEQIRGGGTEWKLCGVLRVKRQRNKEWNKKRRPEHPHPQLLPLLS